MSDDAPPRVRLPDLTLPRADGGAPVATRARRQGTVLVLLGDTPSAGEAAYLASLGAASDALRESDGRAFLVARAARALPESAPPLLVDAEGRVAAAAGVSPPAVVVTDQWGEVYATREGEWLAVEELVQWLGYLSIRCAG